MLEYPKFSVITPSFNQVDFLERTILSVINQNYPNLEFIIIDGGSTDGSIDIIEQYQEHIDYWVSEPDTGQTNAINKGILKATGEWLAWQNSDDIYYPGSFYMFANAINNAPNADIVIGNIMMIDEEGRNIRDVHYVCPTYKSMLAEGMVLTNQAAFWRRSVHEEIGLLDESLHYAFDYEWFLRLLKDRKAAHIKSILGGYRLHDETKTSQFTSRFADENRLILKGRELASIVRHFYQLRRFFLLIKKGDYRYVFRGLFRRISIWLRNLF